MSSGQSRADEIMAKLGKAKVKKQATNWSWDDEELMYEMNQRDTKRTKRRLEKSKETEESKKMKKDEKLLNTYMREERKLFLGGISEDTTEKDLKKVFSQFGTIIDCKVMRDAATGTSRGFGFVTFASSFMTEAALDKAPFEICGAKVQPKRATPDKPRYKQTNTEFDTTLDKACEGKRSIFIGALRDNISEDDLEQYFAGFGRVVRACRLTDKDTGEKKRFGFVDFADYGVVRKIMNITKHYIKGKRIRIDMTRPRIEFSHQTKTVYVGGLEDGIDDPELHAYFSEFGFVTRALRIPDKDGPKRKYGFVDFDDYDAVDMVVTQREHYIHGHRVKVELALPLINDTLYECPEASATTTETWEEKVQRKLQYAIPDQGAWGESFNYEIFVKGGPEILSSQVKIPRGMLEYVVGMAGKVIESIAEDTKTRLMIKKPDMGSKDVFITITGRQDGLKQAQYIMANIVKSNMHKMNLVSATASITTKKEEEPKTS
ncbi:heterogeneous nuclear ribonucleoprotein D0 [Eurytemora carolleeae]|uniref:heterogeneous nuclear ribonucleoprotein D0 n=1 Tax=Eurytemora carolleeae TaxID=1294199 RepID=UPI000C775A5F|nr:heterogeneous nuclear ribonucleoprotein D0 [Eurytemora carolleeae]|eukprot:XP_023345472.1 heterogeneous nuclear ribonucleoprotein D0-like [Eurytemora affinis]